MSLPLALSLLSLLIAIFAVIAVAAVYSRLRALEQTALNPDTDRLADEDRTLPATLLPGPGQRATLAMLLDGGCGICQGVWESLQAADLPGVRLVGVTGDAGAAAAFAKGVVLADPDLWTALYEGYAPSLTVIDGTGAVLARRFVYGDTEISTLLSELLPTGSSHAL
ncbi:hypothetical protein [Nonomuraea sp. SYSU D8015]|uniref:hypothetical protein n=1 Tax=Nonomuraea sp. SYSU D8015 TaxID=2593644 RepID=UPI00166165EF|nr:hypothetical protein [Nonomuraea sp. SYSU D8015]